MRAEVLASLKLLEQALLSTALLLEVSDESLYGHDGLHQALLVANSPSPAPPVSGPNNHRPDHLVIIRLELEHAGQPVLPLAPSRDKHY